MKPQLEQQITLKIKRLGIHGEGIGDFNGFTVFVDGALPDETVTASIQEVRKNFARAKIVSYDQTSPTGSHLHVLFSDGAAAVN
jgi:23S rRNA (uracil1939-C5)-methyltransferase